MDDDIDEDVYMTEPGASKRLKAGDYVMLEGRPCLVTGTRAYQPGKHGAWKLSVSGADAFDDTPHSEVVRSNFRLWVPRFVEIDADLIGLRGNLVAYVVDGVEGVAHLAASGMSGVVVRALEAGVKVPAVLRTWRREARVLSMDVENVLARRAGSV